MKEIIQEVLQAEEQVKTIIQQARVEAAEIKNSADKDMSEKINQAKEQTRQIYQASVEEAKKQGEQLADEKIRQADAEKENMIESNADKINRIADDICKMIVTTEYDAGTR